uniref:Uncharacterized protein n=1 Tax=Oryza punctata TaxID=4537 RepID=A0A0E0JVP4_ORYPU
MGERRPVAATAGLHRHLDRHGEAGLGSNLPTASSGGGALPHRVLPYHRGTFGELIPTGALSRIVSMRLSVARPLPPGSGECGVGSRLRLLSLLPPPHAAAQRLLLLRARATGKPSAALREPRCPSIVRHVAGLDITVDDMRLADVMDVMKALACSLCNLQPGSSKALGSKWVVSVVDLSIGMLIKGGEIDSGNISAEAIVLEVDDCEICATAQSPRQPSRHLVAVQIIWNLASELVPSKIKNKFRELSQKPVGICPVNLLLLTLRATRFFITSHMEDGNCPVNKLLEMLSTCSGLIGVEDGNSLRPPFRLLKLTSTTMILLEDTNSCGRAPDSMLWERLSRSNPLRLPRDGEMCPWRLLEARETSVTVISWLQVIPSHLQQSVPSCHDAVRPPSWVSSLTNLRRELLSCSVHELVREAKLSSSTRARGGEIDLGELSTEVVALDIYEMIRYLPSKSVTAGIEHNQILHGLPCGGWKLSFERVARDVQYLQRLNSGHRRWRVLQLPAESVKTDVEDTDTAGRNQFPRQVTRQRVVRQVEAHQASKVAKRCPLDSRYTSMTAPVLLQVMPSQAQQLLSEVAVLRELGEELVKRALLLICAGAGERSQGDQQHESNAQGRYGSSSFIFYRLHCCTMDCDWKLGQVIPSHLQQSVPSCHDAVRPPSWVSSLTNLRRELLSCSVHELVREAKLSSSTRARLGSNTWALCGRFSSGPTRAQKLRFFTRLAACLGGDRLFRVLSWLPPPPAAPPRLLLLRAPCYRKPAAELRRRPSTVRSNARGGVVLVEVERSRFAVGGAALRVFGEMLERLSSPGRAANAAVEDLVENFTTNMDIAGFDVTVDNMRLANVMDGGEIDLGELSTEVVALDIYEMIRYLPSKSVTAGIEHNQILHGLPCGGWKLSFERVARDVQYLQRLNSGHRRWRVLQLPAESVKTDVEDTDTAGRNQFPRQVTRQRVVRQVEAHQASKVAKRW